MTAARIRILIGSPIRQRPEILNHFLNSLLRLEQDNLELSYYFIDDNENEASKEMLNAFVNKGQRVVIHNTVHTDEYVRNDITHYWNETLVWKVADYKNHIMQYALDLRFDYVFLIDSDLLLDPRTLKSLIESDKDIISEIFWTRWQPESRPQPQVWLKDEYTQWQQARGEILDAEQQEERYQQFVQQLIEPGVYEVGGLGACTLISRRALVRGVNYKPIYNLSFWGEDRHFSLRAVALGFTLYVDTHYPAYHVYRDEDLHNAGLFMQATDLKSSMPELSLTQLERQTDNALHCIVHQGTTPRPSLTLSMVVKNEGNRHLRQALEQHRQYIDQAVIIDDGSTDNTIDICMEVLKGIPVRLISNSQSKFHNEIELRQQQWRETLHVHPEWILNLDADEWFEDGFATALPALLQQSEHDMYCFRLYDFWDETHYREDEYWNAHHYYRPFLLRYRTGMVYTWNESAQHCGRFPANVFELPHQLSPLRLKHYGWSRIEYRQEKSDRYHKLDPEAAYGWREQYQSILDAAPVLKKWQE
ncbi:glycosyltransferase family 2 protein [Paenibacillus sp. JCM 10914]|uniref:glycosyltransferase n=1 Tax=Paenibacillus sp. JCM 10914 TaxID=1236974 RepID=UPI0003CC9B19|nr:glycosyltransferase [Paenibacillus sp. JCM 10914]GAE06953.1 glycosyltransferases [Paenibacillus sp. JCM 10914]